MKKFCLFVLTAVLINMMNLSMPFTANAGSVEVEPSGGTRVHTTSLNVGSVEEANHIYDSGSTQLDAANGQRNIWDNGDSITYLFKLPENTVGYSFSSENMAGNYSAYVSKDNLTWTAIKQEVSGDWHAVNLGTDNSLLNSNPNNLIYLKITKDSGYATSIKNIKLIYICPIAEPSGSANVLTTSLTAGSAEEEDHIFNPGSSELDTANGQRNIMTDGGSITYLFKLPENTISYSFTSENMAGNYSAYVSKDNLTWTMIKQEQAEYWHAVTLGTDNALLTSNPNNLIYLKITKDSGYATSIKNIKLIYACPKVEPVGSTNVLTTSLTAGSVEEANHIYDSGSSELDTANGQRNIWTDGDSITYLFKLPVNTVSYSFASENMAGNYSAYVSKDNLTWTTIKQEVSGAWHAVTLGTDNSLLTSNPNNLIYLKITKDSGYATSIKNIKLVYACPIAEPAGNKNLITTTLNAGSNEEKGRIFDPSGSTVSPYFDINFNQRNLAPGDSVIYLFKFPENTVNYQFASLITGPYSAYISKDNATWTKLTEATSVWKNNVFGGDNSLLNDNDGKIIYLKITATSDYIAFVNIYFTYSLNIDLLGYNVSDANIITKVQPNTAVDSFRESLNPISGVDVVFDSQTGNVRTGTTFDVYVNNEKTTSYKIVIYGDVNSDGDINTYDLIVLKNHLMGVNLITDNYVQMAGNLDNKVDITIIDLLNLKSHILQTGIINQDR